MATPDTEPTTTETRFARLAFPAVLLFHVSFTVWLMADGRVMRGHDSFQCFSLQYYFLNNRVMAGEIPLWMPFMSHGTVSTWWYTIQASPLQNAMLFTGWLPTSVNFFYL